MRTSTQHPHRRSAPRGFTVFFAVLVSSLALAVGLALYDLLSRELVLSQTTTQSQYAIYAADTGAECALYWDSKYVGSSGLTSGFASSTTSTTGTNMLCNGVDVSTLWGTPQKTATAATTTFTLSLGSATGPCAIIIVAKNGDPSKTTITSRGYNTCQSGGLVRLERTLQINY
ncbi:MAG TPA: hypothetical protein VHD37_00085 [Candidatus Paceibacterota bacterium]|nr:hypothetical protein [Candidatus Paceibacterota bacterium]